MPGRGERCLEPGGVGDGSRALVDRRATGRNLEEVRVILGEPRVDVTQPGELVRLRDGRRVVRTGDARRFPHGHQVVSDRGGGVRDENVAGLWFPLSSFPSERGLGDSGRQCSTAAWVMQRPGDKARWRCSN